MATRKRKKLTEVLNAQNLIDVEAELENGADPNEIIESVSPMHLAAGFGLEPLCILLRYGGDPNVRAEDGTTPLHVATIWGCTDSVQVLLANGGDPCIRDQEGMNALDLAVTYNNDSAAEVIKHYMYLLTMEHDQTVTPKFTYKRLSIDSMSEQSTNDSSRGSVECDLDGYLAELGTKTGRRSSVYMRNVQQQVDEYFGDGQKTHIVDVTSPDHPYLEPRPSTSQEVDIECREPDYREPDYREPDCSDGSLHLHISLSDQSTSDSFVTCDGEDLETVLESKSTTNILNESFDYDDYSRHCGDTVVKNPKFVLRTSSGERVLSCDDSDTKTRTKCNRIREMENESISWRENNYHKMDKKGLKKNLFQGDKSGSENGVENSNNNSAFGNGGRRKSSELRRRKYCQRELMEPVSSQYLMCEDVGGKCEYCGGVPVTEGRDGLMCHTCERLGLELDDLVGASQEKLPDILSSLPERQSPTKHFPYTSSYVSSGENCTGVPVNINGCTNSGDNSANRGNNSCMHESQLRGTGRLRSEWNVRNKTNSAGMHDSSNLHTSQQRSNTQNYGELNMRNINDSADIRDSSLLPKNEHRTSGQQIDEWRMRNVYINNSANVPDGSLSHKHQQRNDAALSRKYEQRNDKGNPSELRMRDITRRLNRTSLSLQSRPESDSTFTHVTHLDNFNDSVMTNDESFFERRDKLIVKSEFHDSDISTISVDTVRSAGFMDGLKHQDKGWLEDIMQSDCETISETDTVVEENQMKDNNGLKVKCERRPVVTHERSKMNNLNEATLAKLEHISSQKGYKIESSRINRSDENDHSPVPQMEKENTPSPDTQVNDLWTEVRACCHGRRKFKDKTNILDTAFCGRESMSSSMVSDASTVDYVYRDKENGIALIERHLPSICGSTGSRRSLDSVISRNTNEAASDGNLSGNSQDTQLYDWRENAMIQSTDSSSTSTQSLSSDINNLDNAMIRSQLCEIGDDPGPITNTTRQTYIRRLSQLKENPGKLLTKRAPEFPVELRQALESRLDMTDMADLESKMTEAFQNPNRLRRWREGTLKSSFNYILLDPNVTKNLPNRACNMSDLDIFKTFITAIFYIGKGKRARPYCHLYEAIKQQKNPADKVSKKVQVILDIWTGGQGVVSLHCFQSVIPVEAYTREACMVDAIGLDHLTNMKRGDYYGVSVTYSMKQRRKMGVYLLTKALQIFLAEGERQIAPLDIKQ